MWHKREQLLYLKSCVVLGAIEMLVQLQITLEERNYYYSI